MKSKTLNRIGYISSNAIRQIAVSLFSMSIPFIVIYYASRLVWGEFVELLLFTLLATQIINWGNKEYVLRKLSEMPHAAVKTFSSTLITRFPLVLLFATIGFCYFQNNYGFFLFVWILGRYFIHSAEVVVLFEKKFKDSLFIELACFLLFYIGIYAEGTELTANSLLGFYSIYQLVKGISYLILCRKFISFQSFTIDLNYYHNSFHFFLLSILGFLASKVDVYVIQQFGDKIITSSYQIINSLLVFIMSISAFIYAPFTKNIYRNNDEMIQKSKRIVATLGLIIVPFSLFILYFILRYFLKLDLAVLFYCIAFLYVYPSFLYGIEVVNLFKKHQERRVVHYLLIGASANAILSIAFLSLNYGITGALFGSAIAQILVLVLFKYRKIG